MYWKMLLSNVSDRTRRESLCEETFRRQKLLEIDVEDGRHQIAARSRINELIIHYPIILPFQTTESSEPKPEVQSNIANVSPMSYPWSTAETSMVRKIYGKQSTQKISHLHFNGTEVTDVSDIVNTLGGTFSANSSSQHYSTPFKSFKHYRMLINLPVHSIVCLKPNMNYW